jgi:hypothetical protein
VCKTGENVERKRKIEKMKRRKMVNQSKRTKLKENEWVGGVNIGIWQDNEKCVFFVKCVNKKSEVTKSSDLHSKD